MPTNPFFNNYKNHAEQTFYEDLIVEAIDLHGHDMFYLPRTVHNTDEVLNEHEYVSFNDALQVTMYVKNYSAYEGDGQFLQKFGLEIRDQMTLTVAIRTFDRDVIPYVNIVRPREGDAIFIPFLNAVYQIKFVENADVFYQLGKIFTYDITCELLEHSSEIFNTGVDAIDILYEKTYNEATSDYALVTSANVAIQTSSGQELIISTYEPNVFDPFSDNDHIQDDADEIIDWTEVDPFSEGDLY